MKVKAITSAVLCAFSVAGLQSCGSDNATSTPGGSSVKGAISGFGSIIMDNGEKYDTDSITSCVVDDQDVAATCVNNLSTGMYVSLHLDSNGRVTGVNYDDELEGVATGATGMNGEFTFQIYGVTVRTSNPGTVWDDFGTVPTSPVDIDNFNLEVSGEWTGTELLASYVEKQGDSDGELKGTVSGVVSGTTDFTLTLRNGSTVSIDGAALSVLPDNDEFVELDGTFNDTTGKFEATDFEIEDEHEFDDEEDSEITGTLVQNATNSTGYSIGTTDVNIDDAEGCASLVGSKVEAEGVFRDGVLIVEECESEEDEIEVKCDLTNVSPDAAEPKAGTAECGFTGTTGGPLSVTFSATHLAMFSGDSVSTPFSLNDLSSGGCVEMKLTSDGSGGYRVGLIEDENETTCSDYEIEATAETVNAADITVLGITFDTTGAIGGAPSAGDEVKLKDIGADGTIDTIEVD